MGCVAVACFSTELGSAINHRLDPHPNVQLTYTPILECNWWRKSSIILGRRRVLAHIKHWNCYSIYTAAVLFCTECLWTLMMVMMMMISGFINSPPHIHSSFHPSLGRARHGLAEIVWRSCGGQRTRGWGEVERAHNVYSQKSNRFAEHNR